MSVDRRKRQALRRSGTLEGAKYVHSMIIRSMGRAVRNQITFGSSVAKYLAAIPPQDFKTLFKHIDSLDIDVSLLADIKCEAARRAEEDTLR